MTTRRFTTLLALAVLSAALAAPVASARPADPPLQLRGSKAQSAAPLKLRGSKAAHPRPRDPAPIESGARPRVTTAPSVLDAAAIVAVLALATALAVRMPRRPRPA